MPRYFLHGTQHFRVDDVATAQLMFHHRSPLLLLVVCFGKQWFSSSGDRVVRRRHGIGQATSQDSETDHRVAMSLAVAAQITNGSTQLHRPEAAAVSYPTFWDDLERLQA